MAQYTITHKCGHTETVELYGKNAEREKKIAQMESQDCPACRAAHAQEESEKEGFAKLKGSDKQIAWAADIRKAMIEDLESAASETELQVEDAIKSGKIKLMAEHNGITIEEMVEQGHSVAQGYAKAAEALKAETKSWWFIDHQDDGANKLVEMLVK